MLVFSNDFLNPPFKSFALIKWRIKCQSCQCQSSVYYTKTLSWLSPDQAQSYLRLQIGLGLPCLPENNSSQLLQTMKKKKKREITFYLKTSQMHQNGTRSEEGSV